MQATSITIERTFFLGASGKNHQFPESVRFAIAWSLEGETIEEAEEKAITKLYEMAERERKRRYGWLMQEGQRIRAEQKQQAAAAAHTPSPDSSSGTSAS